MIRTLATLALAALALPAQFTATVTTLANWLVFGFHTP